MQKLNSTLHLLASTVFVFVFVMAMSSVPLLYLVNVLAKRHGFDKDFFTVYLLGMLSITLMYYIANVQSKARHLPVVKAVFRFITHFPLFLAMSMGLSLHNTIAVIEGWRGKKSPFVRTPKFNIKDGKDQFSNNKYLKKNLTWGTYLEGFMALYFGTAVLWSAYWGETIFIVYHVMMTIGFGSVYLYSWKHARA